MHTLSQLLSPRCIENLTWHVLITFYRLKRNPDFYAYLLVLPCILLAVLNLVTFWLPPQNPARMMLGKLEEISLRHRFWHLTASFLKRHEHLRWLLYSNEILDNFHTFRLKHDSIFG